MSKKKKYIILLIVAAVILLAAVIFIYLKGPKHYNYDELPSAIDVISKEDYVTFRADFSTIGEICYDGKVGNEKHELDPGNMMTIPGKELLYMDEETGFPCYRIYIYLSASPWDMKFHREYQGILAADMTHDGVRLGYTTECGYRVAEFCYLNRDGSYVTIWTRGDTP